MKPLNGKVAVVTGAGSGLGRALALAAARRGMKLVLADVNLAGVDETEQLAEEIQPGVEVAKQQVDVSDLKQVEALAALTRDRFDGAHLLFNNAGVGIVAPMWEQTEQDWRWLVNVNVLGVAWGVKAFVPMMLAQGEGHIVNTASAAGWFHQAGSGIYNVTKAGVVALSETLANDLIGTGVGVSVVSPAYFPAGITDSGRVRPAELSDTATDSETKRRHEEKIRQAVASAKITADEIAEQTLAAVEAGRFYVFPHDYVPDLLFLRAKAAKDGGIAFDPSNISRPTAS